MAQIGDNPTFTTTEAVRGALGIDATDINDQTILNAQLDVELGLDLGSWLPSWKTKIAPADPVTDEQDTLAKAITTYCKWWCAADFVRKYLAHVQLYGDGKAELRRFTNFDWEQLAANAQSKADYYKAMIKDLDPDIDTTQEIDAYGLISGGIPTHDPVTNEGVRE